MTNYTAQVLYTAAVNAAISDFDKSKSDMPAAPNRCTLTSVMPNYDQAVATISDLACEI